MSHQLTYRMYCPAPGITPSRLFGLSNGQSSLQDVVRNAGWFNRRGEYLGRGGLTRPNLLAIANGLEPGEVFAVVEESLAPGPGSYHDLWLLAHQAKYVLTQGCFYAPRPTRQALSYGAIGITRVDIYTLLIGPPRNANQVFTI